MEAEPVFIEGKVINKITKKQIKAIIAVHAFGNPCDMEKFMRIKEKYNLKVIEDATEALESYYLEGKYKGHYCGTIGFIQLLLIKKSMTCIEMNCSSN